MNRLNEENRTKIYETADSIDFELGKYGETVSEDFLKVFGNTNWQIVDHLNENYSHVLTEQRRTCF